MKFSNICYVPLVVLLVVTTAGCSAGSTNTMENSGASQESTSSESGSEAIPFTIEGIENEVCSGGYFAFLNFQIRNVSPETLRFLDVKDLGLEVLLRDEIGDILVALPVSFYGAFGPGVDAVIEPNSVGTLMVVNDGFEGTLATVGVRVNGETIYEMPAEFPAPLRDRDWVIKDGMCG